MMMMMMVSYWRLLVHSQCTIFFFWILFLKFLICATRVYWSVKINKKKQCRSWICTERFWSTKKIDEWKKNKKSIFTLTKKKNFKWNGKFKIRNNKILITRKKEFHFLYIHIEHTCTKGVTNRMAAIHTLTIEWFFSFYFFFFVY